jgi:hypothetical protein
MLTACCIIYVNFIHTAVCVSDLQLFFLGGGGGKVSNAG